MHMCSNTGINVAYHFMQRIAQDCSHLAARPCAPPLPCTTSITTAVMHMAVEGTFVATAARVQPQSISRKQRLFRARSYHGFRRTTRYEIEGTRQQDNTNGIEYELLNVSFCCYKLLVGQSTRIRALAKDC
jgi:hypothetical protein